LEDYVLFTAALLQPGPEQSHAIPAAAASTTTAKNKKRPHRAWPLHR